MRFAPLRLSALVALSTLLVTAPGARPAYAQPPGVLSDYRVAAWTDQDGLPIGTIWSITQDGDGFLWLGTDAGLIRFDGARFATPETIGYPAVRSGAARAVFAARDGSVWVGFAEGGVVRLRSQQLTEYTLGAGVTAIAQDTSGTLWASTARGVYRFNSSAWQPIGPEMGLPMATSTLTVAASGDVIVASRTSIFRFRSGDLRFTAVANVSEVAVDAVQDGAGRVWVTDRFAGFRTVSLPHQPAGQNGKGMRLMVDRGGSLWVATFGQGLWRVRTSAESRPHEVHVATDVNGLSNNVIYALFEDRDGNIWAGTTDGLNRLTQHRVTNIPNLGLVTGVEHGANGHVWAATAEALVKLSPAGEEVRRLPGIQANATHADADGTLWVGTDDALIRVDPVTDRPEIITRPARSIRAITSHPEGGLWLLDTEGGLLRFTNGRLESTTIPGGMTGRLSFVHTDSRGTVWIAAAPGQLAALARDGSTRTYGTADGLDIGTARELFEDSRGVLWVAGSRGLGRFAEGAFTSLHRSSGLPSESLTGVVEGATGDIWIGSATGLIRLNQGQFAMYDSSDGVAGTTGWIGQASALRGADGRLWLLTASGLTVVDPQALEKGPPALALRIEQVIADDTRISAATLKSVEPGVSRLQITYTLPNLTSPRRTRFRYRLEGFDSGWIDAGRQRQAIYTNLPPRAYTFVVEATTDSGAWDGRRASWAFTVRPAFYQTAWFAIACVAGVLLVGWSAWRVRVLQVRRQYAMLLAERTRLSRELHDTLLQSLVGVALQCDALADSTDSAKPATIHTALIRLRRQVEGYIRECRQSIWDLRSPTFREIDLVAAIREAAHRAADAAGLEMSLDVTGSPRRYDRRTEEQALRIVQEATNNAARHSHGTRVRIHLGYEDDRIDLRIEDNGRGFDPADPVHRLHGHCGLISMRERAETAGGTLDIRSNTLTGTSVHVIIPAASAESPADAESPNPDSLCGRSSDRARGNRTDHQPAA